MLLPFTDFTSSEPGASDVWYEDILRKEGDGTVPTVSSAGQFASDDVHLASGKLVLVKMTEDDLCCSRPTTLEGIVRKGDVLGHTGLMSFTAAQRAMLLELGLTEGTDFQIGTPPGPNDVSFGLWNDPLQSLDRAIYFKILDLPLGLVDLPSLEFLNGIDPQLTTVALSGSGGTSDAAVSGSVIVNVITLNTKAKIGPGAKINQTTVGGAGQTVDVSASDDTRLTNLAGAVGLTTGAAGIGVGVLVEVINKHVEASMGSQAKVAAGGDVAVEADTSEDILDIAGSAGASSDTAGVAGSFIVVVLNNDTKAFVAGGTGATLHSGGDVSVTATDDAQDIKLFTGGLAFGSTAGVGVAASILVKTTTVDAYIGSGTSVRAAALPGVKVSAAQTEDILLLAIGGAGGGDAGVAGSVVVNVLTGITKAHIDDGVTIGTPAMPSAGVVVSASDHTDILSIAGALAIGGTAGVGAGVDVEVVSKDTQAWIGKDADIDVSGNVTVDAISSEDLTSISVGGSFAGTAAVTINAGVARVAVTTKAFIADGTSPADGASVDAGGSVRVSADERLDLDVISGNLSGGGTAAVGAAAAVPVITKNTHAWIGDYATVNAAGNGSALTVSTGGYSVSSVATNFGQDAVSGDVVNLGYAHGWDDGQEVLYDKGYGTAFSGLTDGAVYYVEKVNATSVKLHANSDLSDAAITIGTGTGTGHRLVPTNEAGVRQDQSPRFTASSATVNTGTETITLPYALGMQEDQNDDGDVSDPGETINAQTGDAVVYSSGGGAPIGNLVDGETYYVIIDSIGPNSTVLRLAATRCGAVTDAVDDNCTNTSVQPINLTSTGSGKSHSLTVSGGTPSGDASAYGPRTIVLSSGAFRGVAVTASNSDDVAAVGISAGIAGTAAVNLAGSVDVTTVHTSAHIGDSAKVNCGTTCATNVASHADQSVRVAAANQYYELGLAATLAIAGTAGVAVPVGVRVVDLTTNAYIGTGTSVNAARDISISADAEDTILSIGVGAGGGTVGVAGTVTVTVLDTFTFACTGTPTDSNQPYRCLGSGATLNAGGNILVSSADDTVLTQLTIAIAGGYVGVGAAVGVAVMNKTTEAYLGGNTTANAMANGGNLTDVYSGTDSNGDPTTHGTFRGVVVQAATSEDVFGLAPAVGGGFVGVAGGVAVTVLDVTTKAFIGPSSQINTAPGANSLQSVNVSAVDRFESLTIAGGAAGGFVGVAGGVNVGFADSSVQAYLAGGTIHAKKDVEVLALSTKDVQTYTVSVGGGLVGVAASIAVWSVGTTSTSTYHPSDGGPDKGTWTSGTAYATGDVVTDPFDQKRYAAKVDDPDTTQQPHSNLPEWEGETDSLDGNNSVSGADGVASGGSGGWVSALNGSTAGAPAATPWDSVTAYDQGDVVTYDGNTYRARQANTNKQPDVEPTYWWLQSGGETATNSRLAANIAPANSALSAASPGGSAASGGISSVPNGGTTATIDATVVAGGNVLVLADDTLDVFGIAGSLAGGLVGVGASILILNIDSNTDAGVGPSGAITANGSVTIRAEMDEETTSIAFTGAGGFVGVGAVVAVMNDSGTQTARIDNGAAVHKAALGLNVSAKADRETDAFTIAVAGGAVGVGASVAVNKISGDATARVGNVTIGDTGSVAGVTVGVVDNIDANNVGVAVGGGAVTVNGALAFTTLDGKGSARFGGHGTVGSSGVSVTANGTHTVHTQTLNVNVGAIAIGVTVARSNNGRSTEARVTSTGNVDTTGAVSVTATATNVADTTQVIPQVSTGGATFSIMVRFAKVSGFTRAQVDGDFSNTSSITVQAVGENKALAPVTAVGVSIIGLTGIFGFAEITGSADIEAIVGSSASLGSSGQVKVEAKVADGKKNVATTNATSVSVAAVELTVLVTDSTVAGGVKAELGGSVTASSSIVVNAYGNNEATATTFTAGITLLGSISGAGADAEVTSAADVEALVGSGTLHSTGTIAVTANGTNYAKGDSDGGAGGLVAIGISIPTSTVGGAVKAQFDADVTNASGMTVSATSKNTAITTPTVVQIGLFTGAGTEADATVTAEADTEAKVGSTAQITAPGAAVLVKATSDNEAQATVTSVSVGGATLNVMLADAIVAGSTLAQFDGDLLDADTDALSLTVQARSEDFATTEVDIVSVSIVGAAGGFGDSRVEGDTQAIVGSSADIHVTGLAKVDAQTTAPHARAIADVSIGSGSLFGSVAIAGTIAKAKGAVRARMDGDVGSSSSVQITATGTIKAEAKTRVIAAGLVFGGAGAGAEATVGSTADVEAKVGSGSIATDGQVKVQSTGTINATALSNVGTGGLVGVGVALPEAKNGGGVAATLDADVTSATGIVIEAKATRGATATAQAVSVGLVGVNAQNAKAEITSSANTDAIIGTNADITIGSGTINVSSIANNTALASSKATTIGLAVSVTTVSPTANPTCTGLRQPN